jgi:hypothetical protein
MSPLLLGITLGAAGAFMLDPEKGRRRRALVRDKMAHGREFAGAAAKDLRAGARWNLLHEDWSPGARAVTGGAGAALLLYALARGGITGIGALALGAALLGRASTNRPLRAMVRRAAPETVT